MFERTWGKRDGAEEGTRTPTAFRPPAPKAGASANSATSASAEYNTALTLDCACPHRAVLLGSAASGDFHREKNSWHIARNAGQQLETVRAFARRAARHRQRRGRCKARRPLCRPRHKWTRKLPACFATFWAGSPA